MCIHYKSLTKKHKSTIDVNKFTNQHERTVKNLKEIEVKIFRIYWHSNIYDDAQKCTEVSHMSSFPKLIKKKNIWFAHVLQ